MVVVIEYNYYTGQYYYTSTTYSILCHPFDFYINLIRKLILSPW